MSAATGIEWTDATWNPIVGCSIVSKGCTNCYAMRTAGARTKHTAKYSGLTRPSKAGPVWTGEVRFWEKALTDPLKWRTPRRIFVNSMGDLFHEDIPDEWIDRCFAVMALSPQHTFQILTKRPERTRTYCDRRGEPAAKRISKRAPDALVQWPLPNVWLGVSCEDQATADERIPLLLDTPAAIRFISLEPLLGPIDLEKAGAIFRRYSDWLEDEHIRPFLDWVIVGGESGPGARPMHPDWARSLRDQCLAAGIPFFFKQFGEWAPYTPVAGDDLGGDIRVGRVTTVHPTGQPDIEVFRSTGGRNTVPGTRYVIRLGQKAAGRLLDGREWNEFPLLDPSPLRGEGGPRATAVDRVAP